MDHTGNARSSLLGKAGTPPAPKTCLALSRSDCPNHAKGQCLGEAISSAPEVYDHGVGGPLPRCLLLLKLPCKFFDLAVLGGLPRYPSRYHAADADFSGKIAGWQDRVAQFNHLPAKDRQADPAMQAAVAHRFLGRLPDEMLQERAAKVRVCDCGEPRDVGRSYCPACGTKHRKEATRERVRAHRKGAKSGTGGL